MYLRIESGHAIDHNHMQTSATPLPLYSTSLARPYNHHNPTKYSPTSSLNLPQADTCSTLFLKSQHQSLQLRKSRNEKKKRNHRQKPISPCQHARRHHQQEQHQNPSPQHQNHQHRKQQHQKQPLVPVPQKHTSPSTGATWPPKSCNPTNSWPGGRWLGMR
jgi:hypothetical protein